MLKPICIPCHRFFRPEKNGFHFIEGYPQGDKIEPGTAMAEHWKPYKLWQGDLWQCEGCKAQIVVGVGHQPIAEHYQEDFATQVALCNATYQVNDC